MRSSPRARAARLLAAAGLTAVLVLPAAAPAAAADPVILKLGTIEDLRSLNPYQAAYFPDYETFQLNWNLLVDFGPDLEPIAGFADKWERAADGKSWVFHIREGMKWSDGEPATAKDACFSYGFVVAAINKGKSVGNGYIDPSLKDARVTKVECPDDQTMIAYTDDGTTKILKTYIPILPEHIYGGNDFKAMGQKKLFKAPLVGTGQYQVVEYKAGSTVHLKRNPNYWGQKGYADEIIMTIYKSADTMVQDLKAGNIDYARGVPFEQFDRLKGEPNIQTVNGKQNGWIELGFNSYGTGTGKTIKGGGPSTTALQDTAFRDALGYAIDKQLLIDRTLGGYGDVATTNVPLVLPWHTEPTNPRHFDLAEAARRLDAAGYRLDASGKRLDKDNKPINLRLVMPDSSPTYAAMSQFIKDWYQQLGLGIDAQVIEENSLYDIMLPPEADPDNPGTYTADYDLFIWSWYGSPDPNALLQITLCNQIGTSSDSLWCNPQYDQLYEQQNLAPDDASRKALMDQMQNLFYDEAPYHLITYDNELDAYRTDRFAGWQNQPLTDGVPLFTYSVINYQYLRDVNAPAPSVEPSPGAPAPEPSGTAAAPSPAAPAPSAEPSPGTEDASDTGGSGVNPLLIVLIAGAAVAIGGAVIMSRRRAAADEEE